MFNRKNNKNSKNSVVSSVDLGRLLEEEEFNPDLKKTEKVKTVAVPETFMNTLFVNDSAFFVENLLTYYSKICTIMGHGNTLDPINDKNRVSRKNQQ